MPVVCYDPLDPATIADPYPTLADLRRLEPVFWHDGMRSWVLTRYDHCVQVLRNHGLFARDPRRIGGQVPEPSLSVQTLDPPEQSRVRSLFLQALRAQDLHGLEQRARSRAWERLEEVTGGGDFDVMAELAVPLSMTIICDLLGVEPPEYRSFAAVSDAIMRSMDGGLDPSLVEPGQLARRQLSEMVASWFASSGQPGLLEHVRRSQPPSTAYTRLGVVDGGDGGAGGGDVQIYIRNTARVMFQGGYSTMVAAIGNAVDTLLRHPSALAQLRDGRLGTGVDELVRYDGPVQGTSRTALRPCRIGRTQIDAGQTVVALFAAANHDPAQFPEPCRLVLDRAPNRHLGFGWGTHSCIGTTVAQAALRGLVTALQQHPAQLRATGQGVRRRTATMRVFETLPARLCP